MASIYEKGKSRLVEDLAVKKANKSEEPSKLVTDLEAKKKENMLKLGVSQLVKDLSDKKAFKKMLIKAWNQTMKVLKKNLRL